MRAPGGKAFRLFLSLLAGLGGGLLEFAGALSDQVGALDELRQGQIQGFDHDGVPAPW